MDSRPKFHSRSKFLGFIGLRRAEDFSCRSFLRGSSQPVKAHKSEKQNAKKVIKILLLGNEIRSSREALLMRVIIRRRGVGKVHNPQTNAHLIYEWILHS